MCVWCTEMLSRIWDDIWATVSAWVSRTLRNCSKNRCKGWALLCGCCNKWLCWIAAILVAIIVFVLLLVYSVVVAVVCAVCLILCPIVCLVSFVIGKGDWDRCLAWCEGTESSPGNLGGKTPEISGDGTIVTDDGTGPGRPGSGTGPSG